MAREPLLTNPADPNASFCSSRFRSGGRRRDPRCTSVAATISTALLLIRAILRRSGQASQPNAMRIGTWSTFSSTSNDMRTLRENSWTAQLIITCNHPTPSSSMFVWDGKVFALRQIPCTLTTFGPNANAMLSIHVCQTAGMKSLLPSRAVQVESMTPCIGAKTWQKRTRSRLQGVTLVREHRNFREAGAEPPPDFARFRPGDRPCLSGRHALRA
mmetsp:Transcript_16941/g.45435  ORF Transcript_16941/g.45435 Transcript_16941/m.45435 type:complete len:215 (-) Transcript_16941:884-1528(-)